MEDKCFISGIFVIPKSSGGFRPIVNLKGLNRFVEHFHFKMEGISVMKGMVRKGDFLRKLTFRMHTSPFPSTRSIGSTFNLYKRGRYFSFPVSVLVFHPPLGPSIKF
jgi:hypothetical protein